MMTRGVSQVCLSEMCFHRRNSDLAFRRFELGLKCLSLDWRRSADRSHREEIYLTAGDGLLVGGNVDMAGAVSPRASAAPRLPDVRLGRPIMAMQETKVARSFQHSACCFTGLQCCTRKVSRACEGECKRLAARGIGNWSRPGEQSAKLRPSPVRLGRAASIWYVFLTSSRKGIEIVHGSNGCDTMLFRYLQFVGSARPGRSAQEPDTRPSAISISSHQNTNHSQSSLIFDLVFGSTVPWILAVSRTPSALLLFPDS